jgi:iron complex outermembrane receptor protein
MNVDGKRNRLFRHIRILKVIVCLAAFPALSGGQDVQSPESAAERKLLVLPASITVTVTAQKEPEPAISLPVSITVIPEDSLADANIQTVKQGSFYAPNAFIHEFSARALSNPFFRGIGGSPTNPGVSTVIDGVPQLNNYSSNIELVDVGQIEFVRRPEGALYGRNTAGGLINITSRELEGAWNTRGQAEFGNYSRRDLRASVSSPLLKDRFGISLAGGYGARDGYTRNDFTGNDLAGRAAGFGKAQLFCQAGDRLNIRLIFSAEHDNDGDYALGDLAYIRENPHHVSRDFEGYSRRDVGSATLIAAYRGSAINFSSITGGVFWKNRNVTDLDYQTAALENYGTFAVRDNAEQQYQFTQEFRFSSSRDRRIRIDDDIALDWQAGFIVFNQDYEQNAANSISSVFYFFPAMASTSYAELKDWGTGLYGQVRVSAWKKLIFAAGLRFDHENKSADLQSAAGPWAGASTPHGSFSEVSPQFSLAFPFKPNHMAYISASRGYKAGGFNPPPAGIPAPEGMESYGEEHTWNYELGYKAAWLENRLETTAALFYIDWRNLQLNQQIPFSGGQYFIGNAGAAYSKGLEFETRYRPYSWWDLFGSVGYTRASFLGGSRAYNANLGSDQSVGGNTLPYTPTFTANMGTQVSWAPVPDARLYLRVQVSKLGDFQYDASNAMGQDSYQLVHFRSGVRTRRWFAEGWVDNAFDAGYVPVAIPYAQLGAPSGYIGENGAPLTYGVRAGVTF